MKFDLAGVTGFQIGFQTGFQTRCLKSEGIVCCRLSLCADGLQMPEDKGHGFIFTGWFEIFLPFHLSLVLYRTLFKVTKQLEQSSGSSSSR